MLQLYFDDNIKVDQIDTDGKKFDKVSRIEARSEEEGMEVVLDVNTELYPIHVGEKFRMALSSTLNSDGTTVTSYSEGGQKSLADKFEYVMHGLLYKTAEDNKSGPVKVIVYISFGGLQMMLKGKPANMDKFKVDQRLFLLLRRVSE